MTSKLNGIDVSDWERLPPPPSGPLWQRAAKAIYNPEEKSFLGRTAKRWGIVVAFYLVFYAVLTVLFSICMGGLLLTIPDDKPKFTLMESLIGVNPGVAVRPRPEDGFLVEYSTSNASLVDSYVQQLSHFFKAYENESLYTSKKECTLEDNYGFPDEPCFFVKVNKVYGWKPEYYDGTHEAIPDDMPADLSAHIKGLPEPERKQVWIHCEEEHGHEESSTNATITYPWGRGLPGRFYPYYNTPGYRSPVIAVRIKPAKNTLTTIRCWGWAKNIIHNKSLKEPSGYARFQLQIDESAEN